MRTRMLSIACYLGLAPQVWLLESQEKKDQLLQYHAQQGFALSLLALFCFVLFLIVQVLQYIIGLRFPDLGIYGYTDILSFLPCPTWLVLVGIGIWRASRGSNLPIPLVTRLTTKKIVRAGSLIWGFMFQLVCVLVIVVPIRMSYITRTQDGPASVYMLYPQETLSLVPYTGMGTFTVPRWVFTLGFYPIAEVATARWGDGSVAVKPLTRENLNEAFRYGRLVMVASHGIPGAIPLWDSSQGYFSPEEVAPDGVSPNLQIVYLAGCYIGAREDDWEKALSPARVIAFDRISWESEHVFWLWFVAPGIALELR